MLEEGAQRLSRIPGPEWTPQAVALDIDGTLLKWVDGQSEDYETIPAPVYDAVHRAFDAGAHIVLASGRSPHGMTRIATMARVTAVSVPLSVATGVVPDSPRVRMSRRRAWKSVQLEVEVSSP